MSLAAARSTPSAVKGCADCCCRRNRKAYQATVAIALARDRGQSRLAPRGRCKLFLTQDRCVMQIGASARLRRLAARALRQITSASLREAIPRKRLCELRHWKDCSR